MPDYRQPLEFGYFLSPDAGDPQATLGTARLLDNLGYDLIGIQDHPYQSRHFDTFTLIATILAQTERIRVFPDVANLALRPPTMLAKASATLDQLSGGRFDLGLGSGGFWQAIEAFGGPNRTPGEALQSLEEGIEIIRRFWSGGRAIRFDGEQFRIKGAQPGPLPLHDIAIWLGVIRPRALALTGRLADGWIPSMSYIPPGEAAKGNAIIDQAAREAGRDPAAIRRIYNLGGTFTPTVPAPFDPDDRQIAGPVEHWVDIITRLATEYGFSTFVLWADPDPETLRVFIEDVAPAVRERVAASR